MDLVQLLLEYGSDVKAQTANRDTTLHLTTVMGNKTLVKLALDNGVDKDSANVYEIRPIHDASNAVVVRLLLDYGANPHNPDRLDETLLLAASWRNDVEVVAPLLDQKTNIDAQDDQGRTPLHRGVCKKRLEIVNTLFISGANVNLQDLELEMPLHEAALSGRLVLFALC